MTPDEQAALSCKYTPTQYAFVPVPSGLAVFTAYGSRRTLIEILPSADDLWAFLHQSYATAETDRDGRHHREKLNREKPAFDPLAGISLNLKL
jgi:hypothetical protein